MTPNKGPEPGTTEVMVNLWRDRSFQLFFLARTVSLTGSGLSTVVMPILVFQLTGSASRTALVLVIQAAPYLLFGLVAAAIADRVDRRTLMIGCDVINVVAVASLPLAAAFGALTLTHIYLVGLITATVWVWFDASEFGALPALVGRARIVTAGSALSSTWSMIRVLAPAAGGALAAWLGAAPVLWVDAASFLLSALALTWIPRAFGTRTPRPVGSGTLVRQLGADITEGLRYVRRHPFIWPLTAAGFGQSLTMGAVTGLLVVYGVRQLGLTDTDARLGSLFAAGAIGGLAATLSLPWLVRRTTQPRISLWGLTANALITVGVALATNLPLALTLLLVSQYTQMLVILNGITFRQRLTPDRLQGRVNVTARMIAWGGQPFGAALGGVIADRFSISTTYLLLTAGVATSALFIWCSPLRRADRIMIEQMVREAESAPARA